MPTSNFPDSPVKGDSYNSPFGVTYKWDGTVWINAPVYSTAGGWIDDGATVVHTQYNTRNVGIGTLNPNARFQAVSTSGAVNGITALGIQQTTPGTNHEVGLQMQNSGAIGWLGMTAGASLSAPVNIHFRQQNALGNVWLELAGCVNTGLDNINTLQSDFNGASGWFGYYTWLVTCHGRDDAVTAGASTTGDQTVRSVNWNWPVAANDSRFYKFLVSGKIARAAGDLHLKLQWGKSSAPPVIFDWSTTGAAWANAYFWIDCDVNMYIQAGAYSTRMYVVTDPAAFPAAAAATAYLTNGTYASLPGTGGGAFNVLCNFATSNAGNSVTLNQEYMLISKGR